MPPGPVTLMADLLASAALACRAAALVVLVVAAWGDCRERRIANAAPLWLAILFVAAMLVGGSPGRALDGLLAATAVLAAGLLLWSRGLVGGGDVKLLAATALWAGSADTPLLLLATTLSGGVLALVVLALGWRTAAGAGVDAKTRPSVPYGAAIAAGGGVVLFHALLPNAFLPMP